MTNAAMADGSGCFFCSLPNLHVNGFPLLLFRRCDIVVSYLVVVSERLLQLIGVLLPVDIVTFTVLADPPIHQALLHDNPTRPMNIARTPRFLGSRLLAVALWSTITILSTMTTPVKAFSVKQAARGGGRSPSQPDRVDPATQVWEPDPLTDGECRLIICQISDVYTLEHFASFKTMVEETKKNAEGATVVSMLTGDFLSPYLLSSVDRGKGMMNALGKIPLDYLTWGNHEADIDHKTVCQHVRNFPGKWLNSNMVDHEAMAYQQEYDVIELTSRDGQHQRKVGLCAVLSDDPKLYEQFKDPGAFGGATITNPWQALKKYKELLENEKACDIVVPLEHLYVPDDHKTCQDFDFPVVLSGHDHHRVDEVVHGSRLLKPGMNAVYSTVLEILWKTPAQEKPTIRARFVKSADWEPDPIMEVENERAYDALAPLRNTELARVPPTFEPLSSGNSRGSVCTMGKYMCSLIKSAINGRARKRTKQADAVLLMGGNIRGNVDE
jgi:2',3'-cyclic-nucleotide 2'-phosphodiesterase (5'-nucleotidase family)